MSDPLFLLATAHRAVYTIAGVTPTPSPNPRAVDGRFRMRFAATLGRVSLALPFLLNGANHFSHQSVA